MKLTKIFAIALAALAFTGCSYDKNDWNTAGGVTVSMGVPEMTVKESKGLFNVPVVVTGDANGRIKVTVEVAETSENPAMDDVHYYVTTKSIIIPADSKLGNIEIRTQDNEEINDPRNFVVRIVSADGASLGTDIATDITIKDNDAEFYEKLWGNWDMHVTDAKGNPLTWKVKVIGYEEGEPGYNDVLYISGINGYSWAMLELSYHFDIETKAGFCNVELGTLIADGVNFGSFMGKVIAATVEDGMLVEEGTFRLDWSNDFKTLKFENTPYLYLAVFNEADDEFMGGWGSFNLIDMTR